MAKPFAEFIKYTYDNKIFREDIEWSNLWWDSANRDVDKRYLLIGDSTARMIRSTLSRELKSPVDMIGSSSDVDDILFVKQVDSFFSSNEYKYDAIFVQLGHHARTSRYGKEFCEKDLERYKSCMQNLIYFLNQFTSSIILESIFDQVKVSGGIKKILCRIGVINEKKDMKVNVVTRKKSYILFELSQNNSCCRWLDINSLMDKKNYIHTDHIHYEKSAKKYIVSEMAKMIEYI